MFLFEKVNLTADGEANRCSAGYWEKYRCGRIGEEKGGQSQRGDVRSHGVRQPQLLGFGRERSTGGQVFFKRNGPALGATQQNILRSRDAQRWTT